MAWNYIRDKRSTWVPGPISNEHGRTLVVNHNYMRAEMYCNGYPDPGWVVAYGYPGSEFRTPCNPKLDILIKSV